MLTARPLVSSARQGPAAQCCCRVDFADPTGAVPGCVDSLRAQACFDSDPAKSRVGDAIRRHAQRNSAGSLTNLDVGRPHCEVPAPVGTRRGLYRKSVLGVVADQLHEGVRPAYGHVDAGLLG